MTYRINWTYDVDPDAAAVFERTYGSEGWLDPAVPLRPRLSRDRALPLRGGGRTVSHHRRMGVAGCLRHLPRPVRVGVCGAGWRCDDLTQTERLLWQAMQTEAKFHP